MKHLSKLVVSLAIFSFVFTSTHAYAAKKWLFKAAKVESVEIYEGNLSLRVEGAPTTTIFCVPTAKAGAVRLYTTDAWYKAHIMSIALAAQSTGRLVDVWAEDTAGCNVDTGVEHYETTAHPDADDGDARGMGLPFYGLRIREN